jgi:CheY-like chemotaxis protein
MMTENKTKGTILIVDDDCATIEIISAILSGDFFIRSAQNGMEALNDFKISPPDFVITDWDMPVMNGLELVRELKAVPESNNVPIIMMTGYMTETDNLLNAYNAGVVDFIRKPFDTMELKARANAIYRLAEFYKEENQRKDKELLLSTMRLAEMGHFVTDLISRIESSASIDSALAEELKNSLSIKVLGSTWKQFSESFRKTNPDFERRLLLKHPGVSPAEIKLATLLRLNLNTKEISAILNLSPDGVKVSRFRLRKKLQLESEDSLIGYLMHF